MITASGSVDSISSAPGNRSASCWSARDVDLLGEDDHGRRSRANGLFEPIDPFVRDAEVDDLGGHRTRSGSDADPGEPADRTADDQAEQTGPHRTAQCRATRCGVDRLGDLHATVRRLGHDHRVFELERLVGTEAAHRQQELLRHQRLFEGDADEDRRVGVGEIAHMPDRRLRVHGRRRQETVGSDRRHRVGRLAVRSERFCAAGVLRAHGHSLPDGSTHGTTAS